MSNYPGVQLFLNNTWIDIPDMYASPGIQITRGYPNESSSIQAGQCTFDLNNRSGNYSPKNPMGAYYGSIGKNTLMRAGTAFYGTGLTWSADDAAGNASSSASLNVTSDIDIRMEVFVPSTLSGGCSLAGKNTGVTTSQFSWQLNVQTGGFLVFSWSASGTSLFSAEISTAGIPLDTRTSLRVTLDVNNGLSQNVVTFYTASSINGPWAQLGSSFTGIGTTSIFSSTAALQVGSTGYVTTRNGIRIFNFQLLNGIGGTTLASPNFGAQTPGASSFVDAQSNTWTIHNPNHDLAISSSNGVIRFVGEISEWPPKWDETLKDARVSITASGIVRRLNQDSATLQTAFRRWVEQLPTNWIPYGYWPLEDGSLSVVGLPVFAGIGAQLTTTAGTSTRWGQGTLSSHMQPVLALYGGDSVLCTLLSNPSAVTPEGLGVDVCFKMDSGSDFTITLTDTLGRTSTFSFATATQTYSYSFLNGAATGSPASWNAAEPSPFDTAGHMISFGFQQSGSNINVNIPVFQLDVSPGNVQTGANGLSLTITGQTLAQIVSAKVACTGSTSNVLGVGHVVIWSAMPQANYTDGSAVGGWISEDALTRIVRLCGENGVAIGSSGSGSRPMGPQTPQSFLDTIQECVTVDNGLFFETRATLGLSYLKTSALYNLSPAVTLDFSQGHLTLPFAPIDDDQVLVNDVVASRTNGATYEIQKTTGPLSVNVPPSGVGLYSKSVTANCQTDSQLSQLAAWLVAIGTNNEFRYPALTVNLNRSAVASLVTSLLAADVGTLIEVINASSIKIYDPILALVIGYKEIIDNFVHTISFITTPYRPYQVTNLDNGTPPWQGKTFLGSHTSQVNTAINTTATSLSVKFTGARWVTGTVSIPIVVDGEEMTVTNITGTSSPQTFTVTRSVNGVVKSHAVNAQVSLYRPSVLAY